MRQFGSGRGGEAGRGRGGEGGGRGGEGGGRGGADQRRRPPIEEE